MFGLSPELATSLTFFIVSGVTALTPVIVTWLRRMQVEQERKIEELRHLSIANNQMLEKNNEMTENIAKGSDGIQKKLKEVALRSAFSALKAKEGNKGRADLETDDLDKIEKILEHSKEI